MAEEHTTRPYRHYAGSTTDGTNLGMRQLEGHLEPEERDRTGRSITVRRHFLSPGAYLSEQVGWVLRHILVGFSCPIAASLFAPIPYVGPVVSLGLLVGIGSYLVRCAIGIQQGRKGRSKYLANAVVAAVLVGLSLAAAVWVAPDALVALLFLGN